MKTEFKDLSMAQPAWLNLKKEYFLQFMSGEKTGEFRRVCTHPETRFPVGRAVVLRLGYSGPFMVGCVDEYRVIEDVADIPDWKAVYGDEQGPGSRIGIHVYSYDEVLSLFADEAFDGLQLKFVEFIYGHINAPWVLAMPDKAVFASWHGLLIVPCFPDCLYRLTAVDMTARAGKAFP